MNEDELRDRQMFDEVESFERDAQDNLDRIAEDFGGSSWL